MIVESKLISMYKRPCTDKEIKKIKRKYPGVFEALCKIGDNIPRCKALYTVLITLAIKKHLDRNQDIRYHQCKIPDKNGKLIGFSGRQLDTRYVTPTLKRLGLPSMKESGWLTRSFEHAHPYSFNYPGKIQLCKSEFLLLVSSIQISKGISSFIIRYLLEAAKCHAKKSTNLSINIKKKFTKKEILEVLNDHWQESYNTSGGSNLPVIAIHSLFKCMVKEIEEYSNCRVLSLKNHYASDKKSKSMGDVEVKDDKNGIFNIVAEIKCNRTISDTDIIDVYNKIKNNSISKYNIMFFNCKIKDLESINKVIRENKKNFGSDIRVTSVLNYIKESLCNIDHNVFFKTYIDGVLQSNSAIKYMHKEVLINLIHSKQSKRKDVVTNRLARVIYESRKDGKPIKANIRLAKSGKFSSVKGTVADLKVSRDGFPYAVIKKNNNSWQNVRLDNFLSINKNNKVYKRK